MNPLSRFEEISVEDLSAQAELLRRFDTKFIVPVEVLPQIYTSLPCTTKVLTVDNSHSTSYATHYYDSSDLHTYHDHLKQRRKRFKIRTRFYNEALNGNLEIKIKMPRGQTQKVRWALNVNDVASPLGESHLSLLNATLTDNAYTPLTNDYHRTLKTTFSRTTLFDPESLERITID
jgi:hypothetical protein